MHQITPESPTVAPCPHPAPRPPAAEGRGRVNAAGLGFYERLVDRLLAAGIAPMVTLYHWDLPAALDDRGGWLNPDVADWFADYAGVMFRALDDRVHLWATLNEPWVVTDGGYLNGTLAPGHRNATGWLEGVPPAQYTTLLLLEEALVSWWKAVLLGVLANL